MVLTMTSRASTLEMQADADLPVEAERSNGRLDEVAKTADDAVGQLRRGVGATSCANDRQMREAPIAPASRRESWCRPGGERRWRGRQGEGQASSSVGMRYCGSSRMKGVSLDLRMELFKSHAVVMAPTKPAT